MSDPGDWLNGISSVFAAVAIGDLLIRWFPGNFAGWPLWGKQLWLAQIGAALIVLFTAPTVAKLAGLGRDPRIWLISAAFTLLTITPALAGVLPPGATLRLWCGPAWVGAVMMVGWCAARHPARVRPQGGSAQALTAGALFILLVSVAVLVVDTELGNRGTQPATVCAIIAILGVSGRLAHLIIDLANLARSRHEALTDDLTGVANRRALAQHLQLSRPAGNILSLLILDLDQFKAVNDRFGHATGDLLLQQVTARLAAAVAGRGFLARLGGDEFAIALDLVAAADDRELTLAQAVLDAARAPVDINGRRLQVGASVGIATMTVSNESEIGPGDGGELMRRADTAMYQAKAAGGGVCVFDPGIDALAEHRSLLAEELRDLLRTDADADGVAQQILVHYQPQIDAETDRVIGAEALVRWAHPRLGLLAPDRFLDLVEEAGLMGSITAHVLQQSAAWACSWHDQGRQIRVSVNLATSCLVNPDLLPLLDRVLRATDLDPALLVMEVTETDVMLNPDQALLTLQQIRRRGVGVSIDDYGTGYSSLAYLNTLPADELKLDRSFLTGFLTNTRTHDIIAATIALAHRLGLRLVAEGVEDLPTLNALKALGCDETQGYLHSKPLPADQIDEWISAYTTAPPHYTHLHAV